MKQIIILLTVLILITGSIAYASEKVTKPSSLQGFSKLLRGYGYVCSECAWAYYEGVKHRGKVFKVRCAEGNTFRVTLTPSGAFIVEPW